MGLLQAAYRTYETIERAGAAKENEETLTPVSHMVQNAQIEICIHEDGKFESAKAVPKAENKTIIPVTEASAGRTSSAIRAHPLCDQLRYLAPYGEGKYESYLSQLIDWAESEYSHPKVRAVLRYIQGGTILSDLQASGIIALNEDGCPTDGKIEGSIYDKCMVRWMIQEGETSACWKDLSLFDAYAAYYASSKKDITPSLCMVSGEMDIAASSHPKGILASNYGAKLISANDSSGFTYRGRFSEASQAYSVGYTTSQKAHSALRWLTSNHGTQIGGRTFLWWAISASPLPDFSFLGLNSKQSKTNEIFSYQKEVRETLLGYRQSLLPNETAIVTAFDAATTGRLSVTYYNEMKAHDLLDRLQAWYDSCCWNTRYWGITSPSLKRIVQCAWGTQRGAFIEAEEKVLREHMQQMMHCVIDLQPVPVDLVRALYSRANLPMAYSPENREMVLTTTCAVVRKYRNDTFKEEWGMALDEQNIDRSYLYGRLLAVAEQVERSAYARDEGREPNAIRMQSVFSQRPFNTWRILEEALVPYYRHLKPGLRQYFRMITQSITDKIDPTDPNLNKKLDDTYLLGYYHQRTALTQKKEDKNMEGIKDETTEE